MKSILKILSGLLILIAIVSIVFFIYRKETSVPRMLEHLFSEDVNNRFLSYAARISGKQNLHVARLNRVEVYERTSKAQILGISLPDIVVSVSFPVEYNFNLSLVAPWKFEKRNQTLWVYAPELAAQTPAVNVSEMKFVVQKGSFLRNENDVKEKLQKELTGYLSENSIQLKKDVRSEARKSVEQFVRTWVASQFAETDASRIQIRVVFPGENDEASSPTP
jgi:hypothetical protein